MAATPTINFVKSSDVSRFISSKFASVVLIIGFLVVCRVADEEEDEEEEEASEEDVGSGLGALFG